MEPGSVERSTGVSHWVGTDIVQTSCLGIKLPMYFVRLNYLVIRLLYTMHVLTYHVDLLRIILIKLLRLNHRRYMRHIVSMINLPSREFGLWSNVLSRCSPSSVLGADIKPRLHLIIRLLELLLWKRLLKL